MILTNVDRLIYYIESEIINNIKQIGNSAATLYDELRHKGGAYIGSKIYDGVHEYKSVTTKLGSKIGSNLYDSLHSKNQVQPENEHQSNLAKYGIAGLGLGVGAHIGLKKLNKL